MSPSEFDEFAEKYHQILGRSVRAFGEKSEHFSRYKIQDLAAMLSEKNHDQLRVLDFGAGVGASIPHFVDFLPNSVLTCLDVSEKSLEVARQAYADSAEFVVFDGLALPFGDNTLDVVFSACVLHHIPMTTHVTLLKEFRRVLRPDGLCMIFEHNPINPFTVKVVNECPFDENAVLIRASRLHSRFSRAGFRNVQKRFRVFFPCVLGILRPLERYLASLPIGGQYSIIGKK